MLPMTPMMTSDASSLDDKSSSNKSIGSHNNKIHKMVVSWEKVCDVKVKASLRWWKVDGECNHIKGDVWLERFTGTCLFRIAFVGKRIVSTTQDIDGVIGTVYLPIECPKEVERSLLESKHSCAHRIIVSFQGDNSDGIDKIQLIIPTNNAATNVSGIIFGEALEHSEVERARFCSTSG